MNILLLAEVSGDALLRDATAKAVSAVSGLGDVTVLVAGYGISGAAQQAATIDGVSKVLAADSESLGHRLAEAMADLIVSITDDYDLIAAAATSDGKNIMPRVAALLDVMIISDVTAVVDAETFERPIYAGNAIQTVKTADKKKALTIRTSGFSAAGEAAAAPVDMVNYAESDHASEWLGDQVAESDRPDLTSARVVVSGGRGVGSKEQFAVVEGLADKLGAAVGASRAAVDSGYAPNDWQVGQTGKVVAPELYVACGISGAIQHLAGMKDSRIIVAINKDEEAPIFQVADYGIVGDLFDIVPEMTEKL
ncbi:electron transfer flavoprotein subunit alpha/FixB family protein [Martelella mediterranea]|uniref:Electron transfer flavoprotein subunit alpha n=1 Tax=Martelella mediterranea TaxID=293089 RepID=A0A4R3P2J8_9HYPH|nr:FAD-binding protein [Martelella mediterranea]TCT44928.1 electron transfer flavoprotein alpha subunit apoprotein [Martelella mediterranea]